MRHGGFATSAVLEAELPTSVELVDNGLVVWDEGPDGKQELRLTDDTMAKMAPHAKLMTSSQLREFLNRGVDLAGHTILVVKE